MSCQSLRGWDLASMFFISNSHQGPQAHCEMVSCRLPPLLSLEFTVCHMFQQQLPVPTGSL